MSLLDNLPHLATAKSRVRTADAMGGSKDTWTTVFSGRACWEQGASDRQIQEFAKRGIVVTHKVYFTEDPGLGEGNTLTIGGNVSDVMSAASPDASAGLGVLYRVMTQRTTTGSTP